MSPSKADMRKPHVQRKRRADERDLEVGQRVRAFRLEAGLSQSALAKGIGITFQQVQKYEKGSNRIGAGRLERIAEVLDKPIMEFFNASKMYSETGAHTDNASMFSQVQTRDAVHLLGYFNKIKSRSGRATVVNMAKELAGA